MFLSMLVLFGNTAVIAGEMLILEQCAADNFSIKSIHNLYPKIFAQLNSYRRGSNNVFAVSNSVVHTF
jgi:hypothetical protein